MNREQVDRGLEIGIASLIAAILVFGPLAFGAVRISEFLVIQWLTIAVGGLWLARLWIAPTFRFLWPPTCWAILPFIGYAVWRYRTADVQYLAHSEFIQVVLFGFLFLACVNNLYGRAELRVVGAIVLALGTALAMFGIYQAMTGSNLVWGFSRPNPEGRASGTYMNANHLAGLLEMIWPSTIALLVASRFGALTRIFLAYCSFVILIGIGTTGSRAGWIATLLSTLALIFVFLRTKRRIWTGALILAVVIAVGWWMYPKVLASRVVRASDNTVALDDIRLKIWQSTWEMIKDHPLSGVGPNHFDVRYRAYRLAHWIVAPRPGNTHNDYLNALADWGAIGFLLLLLPLAVATYGLVRSWPYLQRTSGDLQNKGGNRFGFAIGAAIGLFAILVHSFFDFNMHIPANAILAIVLLAVVTAHWRFASSRYWFTPGWLIKIAASLILIAAATYLAADGADRTREKQALQEVDRKRPGSVEQLSALKKAFSLAPKNFSTTYAIGENLRARAFMGSSDYRELATEAIDWYRRTIDLNRFDVNSYLGLGMCLDWLDRHEQAEPYFKKGLALDPNHFYPRAAMGWHYFQVEQYDRAVEWMDRSLEVQGANNPLAQTYKELAAKRHKESR